VEPAADCLVLPDAHAVERKRQDGGVVDVGVIVVLVLEGPTSGREVGPPDRPVALDAHLLRKEVLAGTDELRVAVRDAAGAQRAPRAPARGLARLGPEPFAVLDHEPLPALDGLAERRVV